MLYSEIIAVCSQIHTKHINTLCGQKVEHSETKLGGTYSSRWHMKHQNDVLVTVLLHRLVPPPHCPFSKLPS